MTGSVRLNHWLYGWEPGGDSQIRAKGPGVNPAFYDRRLKSMLYLPVGYYQIAIPEGKTRLPTSRMIHLVGAGEDEVAVVSFFGIERTGMRQSGTNHAVAVPSGLLRTAQLSFEALEEAVDEMDNTITPDTNSLEPLVVPLEDAKELAERCPGISLLIQRPAIETLVTLYLSRGELSRINVLCEGTTLPQRNTIMFRIFEILHCICSIPLPCLISDRPNPSYLDQFNLVLSPDRRARGLNIREWSLLDVTSDEAPLSPVASGQTLYDQVGRVYEGDRDRLAQ